MQIGEVQFRGFVVPEASPEELAAAAAAMLAMQRRHRKPLLDLLEKISPSPKPANDTSEGHDTPE